MNKRSAGVSIFALLFILIGLAGFLSSLHVLLIQKEGLDLSALFWKKLEQFPPDIKYIFENRPFIESVLSAYQDIFESAAFSIIMGLNAVMSFMVALIGVGVWRLAEWARRLTILFFIISIPIYCWAGRIFSSDLTRIFKDNGVYSLLFIYNNIPLSDFFVITNLVLLFTNAVLVTLYFCRKEIRAQFI